MKDLNTVNWLLFVMYQFSSVLKNGVSIINDLLDENGSFLSYEDFKIKYQLQCHFLDYHSILNAIKAKWKNDIIHISKEHSHENENISLLKSKLKPTKCFYPILVKEFIQEPKRIMEQWNHELDLTTDSIKWKEVFSLAFKISPEAKLQSFQYKILHRILYTNPLLFKCNLKATELCSFCHETKETLLHLS